MNNVIDMDKINKEINKKKISISKIAKETGYSRISVYRYLNKKRVPTIDFVNKLLKMLNWFFLHQA